MDYTYWQKQDPTKPLYGGIEWNKPERRAQAGKLTVIGGTSQGFAAVAEAYQTASDTGVGAVRVMLPETLKKSVPSTILDAVFVHATPSGGLADDPQLSAALSWSDLGLLIGDSGRSAETAALFERILTTDRRLVITRDAIDLIRPASQLLVDRPDTGLVISFAQLQKLFQSIYYPKILSFSMPLTNLVETLHKFTLTYPTWIATFHNNQLIVAHEGQVTTTIFDNPMAIWRGTVATRAACYWLWNPKQPLEAVSTSICLQS